jgi:DNA-binding transcriptional ArsR family regulator
VDARRRRATILQAKAASHPLRLRILRLCGQQALTNKQLADRLGSQPGTTLYHVRLLVEAGLLEPAPVRTGTSGALEKPYRSTGQSWWLSGYGDTDDGEPYDDRTDEGSLATIEAFQAELREAGPGSVRTFARFMLHLSEEELRELPADPAARRWSPLDPTSRDGVPIAACVLESRQGGSRLVRPAGSRTPPGRLAPRRGSRLPQWR